MRGNGVGGRPDAVRRRMRGRRCRARSRQKLVEYGREGVVLLGPGGVRVGVWRGFGRVYVVPLIRGEEEVVVVDLREVLHSTAFALFLPLCSSAQRNDEWGG